MSCSGSANSCIRPRLTPELSTPCGTLWYLVHYLVLPAVRSAGGTCCGFALCFLIALPNCYPYKSRSTKPSQVPCRDPVQLPAYRIYRVGVASVFGFSCTHSTAQHLDRAPGALLALALRLHAEVTTLWTQTSLVLCMHMTRA